MSLKFPPHYSPDTKPAYREDSADIFSRGSLMFTYELLRKQNPELALTIRNIVHTQPLEKSALGINNKNTDHFRVHLNPDQVRTIVEGLITQDIPSPSPENMGKVIMAKALIDEWTKLARTMIQDMPEEQRPHTP
ncbi:hypothetical protein [Kiloniella litopenaei]|uniref:hypothetical protein n=1 Tax=Kiloniella litopenaei TaxID=1549748 RepID=UPI003BAA6710